MTNPHSVQFGIGSQRPKFRRSGGLVLRIAALAVAPFFFGCVQTRTASSVGADAHQSLSGERADGPSHSDAQTGRSAPADNRARAAAGNSEFPGTGFDASSEPDALNISDTPEGLIQITRPSDGADFDPVLSRDGKFMVFASTQHQRTSEIYVKNIGSATMTQLTQDAGNDVMPTISPDGQKIAFCSDRSGSYGLYLMSIRGGQPVQLTNGSTDLHPSFSPDGSRLAFCRLGENSGRWELWVLDLKRPSTPEFIGNGLFPQFSPVAGAGAGGTDRIAFQRARQRGDTAYSIWTIDYKPGMIGNPTQVMAATDSAAINPTWSPDGQWIAYTAVPLANMSQNLAMQRANRAGRANQGFSVSANTTGGSQNQAGGQIRLVAADGSMQVNLTEGLRNACMPAWSVDGRVFFASERGGKMGIWSANPQKSLAAASASPGTPITHSAPAHHSGEAPASLTDANAPAGNAEQ